MAQVSRATVGSMLYEIPSQANDVPRLEDYLSAIRKRWRLVLVVTVVGVVTAMLFHQSRTLTYDAEARVVVNPTSANAVNSNLVSPRLEREKEVMASNAVALRAAETVGDTTAEALLRDLDVSFVNLSDTLALTYNWTDPQLAVDRVNALADAYVALREEASLAVYNSQIGSLQSQLDVLEAEVEELSRDIGLANSQLNIAYASQEVTRQARIDELNEERQFLVTERNNAITSIQIATRDLRTLDRQVASRAPTAEVIQYAALPDGPAGPGGSLLLLAGLLFGVMGGVALAFVLDRLDRTARESADVEAAIGTSVLGNVPKYPFGSSRAGLIMLSPLKSSRVQRVREAYRRMRASLQFLQTSKEVTSLVVTSAHPGEGKSVTVANVGVAAAQAGAKVVIVSADLRRPLQERLLGVRQEKGLSNYLTDPSVTDILVPVPGVDGLALVPSGELPPNPGELLGSQNFADLLEDLRDQFDLVLIDMPPVLSTADAGAAAFHADGVVIVVDSQRTDTDALLRARTTIERSGGRIVGAVLNKDRSDGGITLRRDRYAYEKVASQT